MLMLAAYESGPFALSRSSSKLLDLLHRLRKLSNIDSFIPDEAEASEMESKPVPTATRIDPPPCLICKVAFPSWPLLKVHLAGVHGEYRPHSCAQCDFTSLVSGEMAAHAEASTHFVKINQVFDSYKASFVTRLIDDHVEKAREVGGNFIDSAAEPATEEAGDPVPNSVAHAHGGTVATRGAGKKRAPIPLSAIVRRVKKAPVKRVVKQDGTAGASPLVVDAPPFGLSTDELAHYRSRKEGASKEVRKPRQGCFPNKEEKGRKAKKPVKG